MKNPCLSKAGVFLENLKYSSSISLLKMEKIKIFVLIWSPSSLIIYTRNRRCPGSVSGHLFVAGYARDSSRRMP